MKLGASWCKFKEQNITAELHSADLRNKDVTVEIHSSDLRNGL
jgi:hypothetical protein